MRPRNFFLSASARHAGSLLHKPSLQALIFNAVRLNRPEVTDLLQSDELGFLAYCIARRRNSRAQILQDLWVCYELEEMRGGYFVEFGSTNGITNSNTWLLEKAFGWRGILAEPNPFWHADLAANRNAHIEHRCVSSRSGEQVTFLATDGVDPELSGIAAFANGDHFADVRHSGTPISVETISLNDLLDAYDAPETIDYISIDTEGSELDILSSFDFGQHRFNLISVEQNSRTKRAIETLLMKNGYARVFPQYSQWDGWYVSKELRSTPPHEIIAPAL
ncbi:FkbM family methyltransferase [Rhizobiaceae bacterium LC148]|nr:FkbM family methyltransferase [Rhizobiaceae bacterium LC148]